MCVNISSIQKIVETNDFPKSVSTKNEFGLRPRIIQFCGSRRFPMFLVFFLCGAMLSIIFTICKKKPKSYEQYQIINNPTTT